MTSISYEDVLTEANRVGSSRASDAGLMAQLCANVLQTLVGAVSPKLVWEGAQKQGLTSQDLMRMARDEPRAVHNLMWI